MLKTAFGPDASVMSDFLKLGLIQIGCSRNWESGSIRARRRPMPRLPYMLRLIVLRWLIWPSTCSLLHGSTIAFLIASPLRLSALAYR